MHASVMEWGQRLLTPQLCTGARILEVGSLNVNGSLRDHVKSLNPDAYIGVDLTRGKGVDVVSPIEGLREFFQYATFDVVISTEMLEHARSWRAAMTEMMFYLRYHGWMLLTTRSRPFPYHGYPHDYNRFTADQVTDIMYACGLSGIVETDPDPMSPGVFMCAQNVGGIDNGEIYARLQKCEADTV